MNKSIKFYKYANKYIDILNAFYDKYKNVINERILNEEYDLMTDILNYLIYDKCDTWYINLGKKQYRTHIIYKVDKEYWKVLSKLYRKMWKITFFF